MYETAPLPQLTPSGTSIARGRFSLAKGFSFHPGKFITRDGPEPKTADLLLYELQILLLTGSRTLLPTCSLFLMLCSFFLSLVTAGSRSWPWCPSDIICPIEPCKGMHQVRLHLAKENHQSIRISQLQQGASFHPLLHIGLTYSMFLLYLFTQSCQTPLLYKPQAGKLWADSKKLTCMKGDGRLRKWATAITHLQTSLLFGTKAKSQGDHPRVHHSQEVPQDSRGIFKRCVIMGQQLKICRAIKPLSSSSLDPQPVLANTMIK